tara:strand:+ start:46 stop:585 length:540 start_codon:yes stop_codon:yes gene_type:complete
MIKLKDLLKEQVVRLSTYKDADFEPGSFVSLLGKKGRIKLDKKSVHKLAKIVRTMSGKHGMGWSFTEGKLKEASAYKTATRNELAMYITQLSNTINGTKDRKMLMYLKKTKKEVSDELKSRKKKDEGKLTETTNAILPNGVQVKIDFNGITLKSKLGKVVVLDRGELQKFFKATRKYLK